jgi:long-chain acyl-CoA synthetase
MMADTNWGMAHVLRHWAAVKPEDPCMITEFATLTWQQLHDRSSQVAQGLLALGVEAQDRVLYLGRNRSEFFEILLGAAKVGVVTAAVNWRLAPREIQLIIGHSQAKIVFAEDEFLGRLSEIRGELPLLRGVVVIRSGNPLASGNGPDGDYDADYEELLAGQPATDPMAPAGPEDIGLQMYTSGTTGVPKGVMFSNRALMASDEMAAATNVDEASCVLVAMPVFHASGSSLGLLALATGARTVIAKAPDPQTLLGLICRHRVTLTTVVPAVLKMMIESPAIKDADLTSLDTIVYAASPISPDLLGASLKAFGCRFLQVYGMTETLSATLLPPEDHLSAEHPERMKSAGRPLNGVRIRVTDSFGNQVPEGAFGEIRIQSPTGMSGYFQAPEETAAAIDSDGFIRTGDGGYVRDGYVYLSDRIKDMIITGGENVYSIEVENALLSDPRINDAAVIGVPSQKWGETVKAIVVRDQDSPGLSPGDVITVARERLARYKVPTSVEFVPELPRNAAGKVLKHVLRDRFRSAGGARPVG